MKRYLIKIFWFILPLIVLAYPLDWIISTNLKKSNNFFGREFPVWNEIYSDKTHAQTYIYGSSRALIHIDPNLIADSLQTSAFNFGVNGHNFKLQKLRHDLLLRRGKTPQMIIHSMDIFTLSPQTELFNKEQFIPYMLHDDELKKGLVGYEGFTAMDFELPLIRYYSGYHIIRESLTQFLGIGNNAEVRRNGFDPQDLEWDGNFDQIKRQKKMVVAEIDPGLVKSFKDYLIECRKANIEVVLVYTPEYYEFQKMVTNRKVVIDLYKSIATQNDIRFFDYSNDTITKSKKYFYNATHMNLRGAKIFNQDLVQKLRLATTN